MTKDEIKLNEIKNISSLNATGLNAEQEQKKLDDVDNKNKINDNNNNNEQPHITHHHETKLEHIIEVLHHDVEILSNLRKDATKIVFLVYIYFLQGIPLGLTASIPLLLTDYSIDYSNQGAFSFANWPFSIKLLWAPVVDSLYIHRFGRRKSWIIPTQLLIGIFMMAFANTVQNLIQGSHSHSGN
jgi:hypothetical protein